MNQQDYSSLLKTFETYLKDHPPIGSPDSLYEPIRYINNLGGKRIRPVLLLMAYNLWHEDISPALPAALAVEYFHNFSLMHDDIMDEATLRRGNESVHIRYGRNAAILSGDAMLIKCFQLLLDAGRKNNSGTELCLLMADTATAICEGQQMDMDFERIDSPSEQEYLEMIRKKTACLIGASLKIGAHLAGAPSDDAGRLYRYGENIGIAFQVRDDLLDVFGNTNLTGKQHGGDILRGKKNFLYISTSGMLKGRRQSDFMNKYFEAATEGNIREILDIYDSLKVEDYAKKIQQDYFSEANQLIETISSVDTSALQSFSEELITRDH